MGSKTKAQLESELKGLDDETLALGQVIRVLKSGYPYAQTYWNSAKGDSGPTGRARDAVARLLRAVADRFDMTIEVKP